MAQPRLPWPQLRRSSSFPPAQLVFSEGPPSRRARYDSPQGSADSATSGSLGFGDVQAHVDQASTISSGCGTSQHQTAPMASVSNGIPAEVERAVSCYQPKPGFVFVPPSSTERSFIFKWGVRVYHTNDRSCHGWICLASQACRDSESIQVLYSGKTSRATKHLKDVHGITSSKTSIEDSRKRTRDEEVSRILASATSRENCQRISLLLQTLQVVHNNLPFVVGEWEESQLLKAVITKEEFRAIVNRQTITHSVIELYSSGKLELTRFLRVNRLHDVKSLVMVTDFWTCKTTGTKYLGLRVYYVDAEWNFGSILLGTRHFRPLYGERDQGIREPYSRWLKHILADFNLATSDFFGATTDGGADVKWMMQSGLQLNWEWCWPHLTNAATKAAFGMTGETERSKNPGMRKLLSKVTTTIYQVRSVEVMGSLYSA